MTRAGKAGFTGTGPGPITPDGCAVDLYARRPAGDEARIIGAAVSPPAGLLELGCGAGRVTKPLTLLGYEVTAVDESPEMLARVTGARTVCSAIEDLALPATFDIVLLGSFLVHGPDASALLRTCRRHVAPGGHVLIQREGAGWHDDVPRERPAGDGVVRVMSDTAGGDGLHTVHVEYVFPDARWTQTFRSRPLTVAAFESLLHDAGLVVERYLTPDGTWVMARAAGPAPQPRRIASSTPVS